MSAFKVGDRVKRIADPEPHILPLGLACITAMPLGQTGTVTRFDDGRHVYVLPDGGTSSWPCFQHTLAPLTPPQADADSWAADKVREVTKPRYEPIRTKERA